MDEAKDVNSLLDDLSTDSALQKEWELNPREVLARYELTAEQADALVDGNVDGLIQLGLAERHVQQMRVSW